MEEEKVLYNATVCYLIKEGKILLALKTCKIGKGFLNGYGGGVEAGEKSIETAVRELKEETDRDENKGVVALPEDLEKIAIIDFHNTKSDGETFICQVHFYLVKRWEGEANDTDEMINPAWYDINNLPFDKMMVTDREWLPLALSGKKIIAKAKFGSFQKTSLGKVEIEEVSSFPEE